MSSPEDKLKHSRRRKNYIQRDLYKKYKEKDHSEPVDKKEKYPKRIWDYSLEDFNESDTHDDY